MVNIAIALKQLKAGSTQNRGIGTLAGQGMLHPFFAVHSNTELADAGFATVPHKCV